MKSLLLFIILFNLNEPPFGTVKIKNYYVDRTEILNIHWLEYIHYMSKELDSAEIQKLLPDSKNIWFEIPANRYKPIVLISHEQALKYCEWRSEIVSSRIGRKVSYRLPTHSEWTEIANELLRIDSKQIEKELHKTNKQISRDSTKYQLSGIQNPKLRVYNFFGNVREMTSDKGIAMGSFHSEEDMKLNLSRLIEYQIPGINLGFRCIAEWE